MKQLPRAKVDEFKSHFLGEVLLSGDADYDEVRQIWNAMIDRRPALIARCVAPEDVVQAVKFARQHNLLLSIRGGGHNIAGNAVCDDGLMIDLSLMKRSQARRRPAGPSSSLAAPLPTLTRPHRRTALPHR
ncbi:MAG: FAD-binding protein [Caldilineaceae bacterium]